MTQNHSLTSRLALSTTSPLLVYRFGRSLRFCHLGFYNDGNMSGGIGGVFEFLEILDSL